MKKYVLEHLMTEPRRSGPENMLDGGIRKFPFLPSQNTRRVPDTSDAFQIDPGQSARDILSGDVPAPVRRSAVRPGHPGLQAVNASLTPSPADRVPPGAAAEKQDVFERQGNPELSKPRRDGIRINSPRDTRVPRDEQPRPPAAGGTPPRMPPPPDAPLAAGEPEEPHGPQLADALFEFLAGEPPMELEDVGELDRSLNWLGQNNTKPPIVQIFDPFFRQPVSYNFIRDPDEVYEPTIDASRDPNYIYTPEMAHEVVDRQLADFTASLRAVKAGVEATEVLSVRTHQQRFERSDHGVVDRHHLFEPRVGEGYPIGQFEVRATPEGVTVSEIPASERSAFASTLLRFNHPSGEIRFVHQNSQERYRVTNSEEGLSIVHETIRTLKQGDPGYLGDLRQALKTHEQLLLRAAMRADISSGAVRDLAANSLNSGAVQGEVDLAVAALNARNGLPLELKEQLATNATIIWDLIRAKRFPNSETHTVDSSGLLAVGTRVQAYFNAILGRRLGDK